MELKATSQQLEEDKNEEIEKLKLELRELREKYEETEGYFHRSKVEAADQIAQLEHQILLAKSESSIKTEESSRVNDELLQLRLDLEKKEDINKQLRNANETFEKTISQLKAEETTLLEQLQAEKLSSSSEISQKCARILELEESLQKLVLEKDDYVVTVQTLKAAIVSLERDVLTRAQELASQTDSAKREMEKSKEEKETTEKKLKTELEALRKEVYDVKDSAVQLRSEKDAQLRQQEDASARRLREKEEKIGNLEDQLMRLREMQQKFEG